MARRSGKTGRSDLGSPELYFNRELSWISFNERVLEEAEDQTNPLLERLKFCCIFSSNLDEFFMVRVAGLKHQLERGPTRLCNAGLSPEEQLARISRRVHRLARRQQSLLCEQLLPALREHEIRILGRVELNMEQQSYVERVFEREVFPVLTPIGVDSSHPFPLLLNLSLNLAALVEESDGEPPRLAVVQVPQVLPRLLNLGPERGADFILLEDVVEGFLHRLFPKKRIVDAAVFRITRDAELEFDDEGGHDFLHVVEAELRKRRKNVPVRLEVRKGLSKKLLAALKDKIGVGPRDVYVVDGPIDIRPLMALLGLPGRRELKDAPFPPQTPPELIHQRDLWQFMRQQDLLLHHPYDSFEPVVQLVSEAAADPAVLAIKMTLYRTSGGSPIIQALSRAAENGKQVTVLVELMARFDEEQNVSWARQLEEAGAHVIYGVAGVKTHSKIALVVRREMDGIRRYVHLGTGNYNDRTAKLYTDMGLLTTREEYGADASAFFNTITGIADPPDYRVLTMAPVNLRERFIALIDRERERAKAGQAALIMAKMNSLVDKRIIMALYRASGAGVKIRLNVRGICCLRPGVKRVSENIEVVSIVDRFLEHSRVYCFFNGGQEEVYLSSADWMPRNLDKRIELMFPVDAPGPKQKVIETLKLFFADNVRARRLTPKGNYVRKKAPRGAERVRCQVVLHEQALKLAEKAKAAVPTEFRPQTKAEN